MLHIASLLLLTSFGFIGQEKTQAAPVDLVVTPKKALIGQPVVITGFTGQAEGKNQISIVISIDKSSEKFNYTETVNKEGKFSFTFSETKKPGKYVVEVTAPDGKGKGTEQFEVHTIGGIAEEAEKAFNEINKRTKKQLSDLSSLANSLPASEERNKLIEDLKEVEKNLQEIDLPPVVILGELRKAFSIQVVFIPDATIMGELGNWVEEANTSLQSISNTPVPQSRDSVCETINTAIEGLRLASILFNVTKSGLKTLARIALDKGTPAAVEAALGKENTETLAISSAIKAQAGFIQGKEELANSGLGLVLDVAEFVSKRLLDRYCVVYRAPFIARFLVDFRENGQTWLQYGVRLEGRMVLRFEKNTPPGQPIAMTGEFEGNATNFTLWDNVFLVEPLPPGVKLLNKIWLPPPKFVDTTSDPLELGVFARMGSPSYFNVPVVAQMTGDTIKMDFKEARVDFSPLIQNRLLIVVMTPLMPTYELITVPIQKARFIIARGFQEPAVLTVKTDAAGKRYLADRVTRDHDTPGLRVQWQIDYDTRKTKTSELGGGG